MQGSNRANNLTFTNSDGRIYFYSGGQGPNLDGLSGNNKGGEKNAEVERKAEKAHGGEEKDGEKEIGIAATDREETTLSAKEGASDPDKSQNTWSKDWWTLLEDGVWSPATQESCGLLGE
ncbi:hypothetical protein NDU88_005005 [Pleurodeles waltl]|uniref:Uncharacterized protein n=1 Tax=Pleurodeles waltl TaxID=8319 RepID=A0AAV7T9F3_PLEWA|nr:hypothetical protein NDU88_005005 [Pleurodeles waltl]